MIEVCHLPPSRSIRVVWILEELGIPYKTRAIKFPPQINDPEYIALNPAGLFPTVIDGEEVLTESLSICDHLARKHGGNALVINPGEDDYRIYQQWLFFGEATLGVPLANVMRYGAGRPSEEQVPRVVSDALTAFSARLAMLEKGLTGSDYLAGGRFTLADISVGYVLWLTKAMFHLDDGFGDQTAKYTDRILARPALGRALAKQ
jgi:glutathione S-transferase